MAKKHGGFTEFEVADLSQATAENIDRLRRQLHSAYTPMRLDVVQEAGGPSMTRQEFADECDVNGIMARYEKTGLVPVPSGHVNVQPTYLDLTVTPPDLMAAMNQMIVADEAFMRLPAVVRKEFDNDAMRFVEFASDPANLDRMRQFGLAAPAAEPDPPMRVEVVNPPPETPEA